MALTGDWKASLAFSERLDSVDKIAKSVVKRGEVSTQNDATKVARGVENDIYISTESLEHYRALISAEIEKESPIKSTPLSNIPTPDPDLSLLPPEGEGQIFGHYRRGIQIRDAELGRCAICLAQASPQIHDRTGQSVVALKITTSSLILPPHDPEKEARILSQLHNDHVVTLLDTFTLPMGRRVLVFPYIQHTLMELLQNRNINHTQVKRHLKALFQALDFIHAQGIIHRDVKPSNILLKSPDGPAYLADFGIAWSPLDGASEKRNEKITDVGTTTYRAPELMFGDKSYGCALDLWAAGCVVAECACLSSTSLFDGGYYGDSELALLSSMFQALGTPNLEIWPEAAGFPDWGKMQFKVFPPKPWSKLLPNCEEKAIDLVKRLLRYQSSERLSALKATEHDYFLSL